MGKLLSFIMVTLDGFYEGPNQEFDWPNADEEFNEFAISQLNDAEMLLFGRVTYQLMAGYWPTPEAEATDPQVARHMNAARKVVFSTTLEEAAWNNCALIREHVATEVGRLKAKATKDLMVLGSPNLTANLIKMGLLDELRIMVNPIVLGSGKSLFEANPSRVPLKLTKTTTFSSGNVLLYYTPLPPTGSAS